MTSLFDGMTGVLNDVFGAPVVHVPAAGGSNNLTGIFREDPIEVDTGEGDPITIVDPTLRLRATDAAGVAVGDQVTPEGKAAHKVASKVTGGSPASDGFVIFQLELVTD